MTKELGVIGGLGPAATAYFMELIVKMTDADSDNEHIPMVIYNKPFVPDRTNYILGKSKESPLNALVSFSKSLVRQGVDFIAIPCVTAHYFYEALSREIKVPIINMISETAEYLLTNKVEKVGIMATEGTIAAGFFEEYLENRGIRVTVPSKVGQDRLTNIIYGGIKANRPFSLNDFYLVDKELKDNGAQVIILGCTELSLIRRDYDIGFGFLDAMEVLAQKSVLLCSGRLKKEYNHLITKSEIYHTL